MEKITRRDFIKKGSIFTFTYGVLPFVSKNIFASEDLDASDVLQIFSQKSVKNYKVNSNVVNEMMDKGMKLFTNKSRVSDAWKVFFNKNDIVGIKINATDWQHKMISQKSIIDNVIKNLKNIGIPSNNIIIWDRFEPILINSGYNINETDNNVRVIATEMRGDNMSNISDKNVYIDLNPSSVEGTRSYYSKIITKMCSKIINIPILKHHSLAGITFCLKNIAYGVTNNNRRFHMSNCNPFIPIACKHHIVKEKVVLNIGDALYGLFDKGPLLTNRKYRCMPKSILFSTDMVACDKIGLELIERKRKEKGLASVWKEFAKPVHMKTAAEMGIGNYKNINHKIVKL